MLDEFKGRTDVGVAVRDRDGCRVAGSDLVRPMFSVTKMFVAVAVLRLVELGELALDEEVSGWLPRAPAVTVRQLLGHTGGLPDYVAAPEYGAAVAASPGQPWSLTEIVRVGLAGRPSPQGVFRYSNLGYWLLGAMVEKTIGQSLGHALAELVFTPAGMASTFYPHVGVGVTEDGYDTCWAGPAGAAWSTPEEVTLFLSGLYGGSPVSGSLISAVSLAAMTSTTPVVAGAPWRQPGYGLGLMTDGRHGTFGHGGDGPGFRSAAFIAPELGRSVTVVARSSAEVDPTDVALRLLGIETWGWSFGR